MVKYLQDYALHEYLSITPPKSGLLALHTVGIDIDSIGV